MLSPPLLLIFYIFLKHFFRHIPYTFVLIRLLYQKATLLATLTHRLKPVGLRLPFFKMVEKTFSAVGGNNSKVIDAITKKFGNLSDKGDDFRINLVKQTLSQIITSNEPCSVSDREKFTQYYEHYHSAIRGGKLYSVEDFRADFGVDIQILQDVLINAFVRAISIEKPFVARETKSIDDIIDYIESKSFSGFLSANFYKIKYRETQILDKQRREQEQNAAIINSISGILDSFAN